MGDFNINLRLKYEQQCPDCGLSDFVEDHASGDLVCRVSTRHLPAHTVFSGCSWLLISCSTVSLRR